MLKKVLSAIAGIAAAVITFLIVEKANHSIFPFQSAQDNGYPTQDAFLNQPMGFFLLTLLGWLIGSFLAGYIAQKISKTESMALPVILGVILTLSGVANFMAITHPNWFVVVGLFSFLPAVLLGNKLAQKRTTYG